MLAQLGIVNIALMIAAIALHYPYGKRLGIRHFITGSLAGLCLTALVVAAMANFCAGAIHCFILCALAGGAFLGAKDAWIWYRCELRQFNWFPQCVYGVLLLTAGSILLAANHPQVTHVRQADEQTSLMFNRHDSYYSVQSCEMLRADYRGRLRIANIYPAAWGKYHFFNAAVQAVGQALVVEPGLLTYYLVRAVLAVLVMLSFLEALLRAFRVQHPAFVMVGTACWFIVGMTQFAPSLQWNLVSSGVFTVFGIVHLIFAAHRRVWREVLVFMVIATASAARMLPVAMLLLIVLTAVLCFLGCSRTGWSEVRNFWSTLRPRICALDAWGLCWFVIYYGLTLGTGTSLAAPPASVVSTGLLSTGWHYLLSSYFFAGHILRLFGFERRYSYFQDSRTLSVFWSDPVGNVLMYAILASLLTAGIAWIVIPLCRYSYHCWQQCSTRQKRIAIVCAIVGLLLTVAVRADRTIFFYLIVMPYLAITAYWALLQATPSRVAITDRILQILPVALVLAAVALQAAPLGFEVKAPALYSVLDCVVWAILALVLAEAKGWKRHGMVAALACLSLMMFSPRFTTLTAPNLEDRHTMEMNISALVSNRFSRADFVDTAGTIRLDNPSDADQLDCTAAILGARVPAGHHATYLTRTFMNAPNTTLAARKGNATH